MNTYDSYKDSGVEWIGEIPSGWEYLTLKSLCDLTTTTISKEELNEKRLIHYSIPNVQEFGRGVEEDGTDIDSSKILLNGGEVLLSKLNPRKSCVTIVGSEDGMKVGSGEFLSFLPKGEKVFNQFLFYSFKNQRFTDYLDSSVESVTRSHQRVRPDVVYLSKIGIPPLNEQHQIVEYLDKKTSSIDSLIQSKEKKITLLNEKRTSLINQVVTKGLNPDVEMKDSGVEWIGEIPSGWRVRRNKYFTISQKEKSVDGSEELLSVSEHNGVIPRRFIRDEDEPLTRSESLEGYLIVKSGDLVSNIMLMWKRGLGVSEYEGIVSPSYSVFSFGEGTPKYFHYLFRTDQYISEFRRNSTGVIESRLRLYDDSFGRLYSHFPPLSEQHQIVEYLDRETKLIDETISSEGKKIELLKEYKQSLISEVVTGKRKVVK